MADRELAGDRNDRFVFVAAVKICCAAQCNRIDDPRSGRMFDLLAIDCRGLLAIFVRVLLSTKTNPPSPIVFLQ